METPEKLAGDPMDWQWNYEARRVVEAALKEAGLEISGAGVGAMHADIDVTINGKPFSIVIRQR